MQILWGNLTQTLVFLILFNLYFTFYLQKNLFREAIMKLFVIFLISICIPVFLLAQEQDSKQVEQKKNR